MKILEVITLETSAIGQHVIVNQDSEGVRAQVCEPGATALAVVAEDSWPSVMVAYESLSVVHQAPQAIQ